PWSGSSLVSGGPAPRCGASWYARRRLEPMPSAAAALEDGLNDPGAIEGRFSNRTRRSRVGVVVVVDASQRVGGLRRRMEAQQAGAVRKDPARARVLHDRGATAREVADRAVADPSVLQAHARRFG